jgi:RNA polymerase sigma factor (sigma-70 family)
MPGFPDNRDISLKQQRDIFLPLFRNPTCQFPIYRLKIYSECLQINDLQCIDYWHQIEYTSDEMEQLLHIINGCYKKNRQSQRSLYEHYYGYFLRVTFRYIDTYEEARRLTDNAFIVIFRNFAHFRLARKNGPDVHLRAWMKRMVIAAIIGELKPKIKLPLTGKPPNTCLEGPSLPPLETPAFYAEVIETIRRLPPGHRTVFNLHVIDRYPLMEIATMLGMSEQTITSCIRISREYCIKSLFTDAHL